MPRQVEFQGQVHEFPDNATDEQVRDALTGHHEQQAAATTPDRLTGQFGKDHPILAAPIDFLQGVGAGAMSTIVHGGDLIRRGLGMERIIDKPEVQQLINSPDSVAAKAGKFAEQGAEFMAPMGAVSKATKGAGLVLRMGAEGLAAGGVSAVQSGGDPAATVAGTAAGAAGPAVGAALGTAGKAIANSGVPKKLYQSALKPTWSMAKKDGLAMLETGLKNEIPVSSEGLDMVQQKIADLQKQITDGVQAHAIAGRAVDSSKVLASLDDLENFYRNTAAPQKSLDTLTGIRNEFQQFHGQQVPIEKAQQIKINTYQELKQSYGDMMSARVEGLKAVTRGLKEQIESVFPEIKGLNAEQSKLLDLDGALARAVFRSQNQQVMGIGPTVATAAGHTVMGAPGAAVGFAGKLLLDNPELKSKLAIALTKAGAGSQATAPIISARLAALKAAWEESASKLADSHGAPNGQLAPALPQ